MEQPEKSETNREYILELEKVSCTYKTMKGKVLAVEDLSLKVSTGEFLAIVGPSGCGKSTILKIIAGLLPHSAGTVKIKGKDISGPYPGISMCFQSPTLLSWRNLRNNIRLPLEIMCKDPEELKKKMAKLDYLLKLTRLEEFADKYPFELSGGMQQRVSLARALISDPDLLLMDEPFGALDEFTRVDLGLELVRIWEATGSTIVFVTHQIPEALRLATRVLVLSCRPGKVVAEVPITLQRPRDEYSEEFGRMFEAIRKEIVIK